MKIELMHESTRKGVTSFPNDKTVVIGRKADADLILEGDDISRDHLHVTYKSGKVFLTDQGSTCGVFVNEERIPAFKDYEFTTYFQARVGKHHFLSLLSHEDDDQFPLPPVKSEKAIMSEHTKSFQNYKLKAATKKTAQKKAASKVVKKQPKKSNAIPLLLLLLLVGAVIYYLNR